MFRNLDFEHRILVFLFVLSYFGAMFIQIRDPKAEVKTADWLLGFLTSVVGSTITYFMVSTWTNVGTRMAATIIASLVSYRTFKFIVSNEAQEDFARGFWRGVITTAQRLVNNAADNQNDTLDNDKENNTPPIDEENHTPKPDNNN